MDRNDSNVVLVVSEKSGGTDEKSGPSHQDELHIQIPSRVLCVCNARNFLEWGEEKTGRDLF